MLGLIEPAVRSPKTEGASLPSPCWLRRPSQCFFLQGKLLPPPAEFFQAWGKRSDRRSAVAGGIRLPYTGCTDHVWRPGYSLMMSVPAHCSSRCSVLYPSILFRAITCRSFSGKLPRFQEISAEFVKKNTKTRDPIALCSDCYVAGLRQLMLVLCEARRCAAQIT